MDSSITILFLGDVVGKPGRRAVTRYLASEGRPQADLVIVNAENMAHGFGMTEANIKELLDAGADVLTGGNHTFDRKELSAVLPNYPSVLRPANYPEGTPGTGYYIATVGDTKIAIINLLGRVFMEPLRSPFLLADELVEKAREETNIIFLDMHAEATAEKVAMGWYLDGKVSAVVGTHTHVQTADEHILPKGTAYITDAGCCGPMNSVIGMSFEAVFRRLVQQMPARFEVAEGPAAVCGVFVTIDRESGRGLKIERVRFEESAQDVG
jgi:metallophosphoesterase (TIGR00282 family)